MPMKEVCFSGFSAVFALICAVFYFVDISTLKMRVLWYYFLAHGGAELLPVCGEGVTAEAVAFGA